MPSPSLKTFWRVFCKIICGIRSLIFGVRHVPRPTFCPEAERAHCSSDDEESSPIRKSSRQSMKPSDEGSPSKCPKLWLWRRIKRPRWEGKNPESSDDVNVAAGDFALRPVDDYLSFFEVADQDEGCRVAAAYRVCSNERPQNIDFMLLPRQSLLEHGIELDHKPDEGLPEFLSSRHLGTRGPRHKPDKEFIMQLLSSNLKIIKRLSIEEIVQIARTLRRTKENNWSTQ